MRASFGGVSLDGETWSIEGSRPRARRRSLARMLRDTRGVAIGLTGGQKRALRCALVKRLEQTLADHRPDQWDWSCTCGEMESATWRTHRSEHHAHLAAVIAAQVESERRP